MKTPTIRSLILLVLAGLLAGSAQAHEAHRKSADFTAAQKQFLQNYEGIRVALAADDLAGAQKAAAAIDEPAAGQLVQAANLKAARTAFKTLSQEAVGFAKGHPGYFVLFCPMVSNHEGYWVQTNQDVNNPYMGKMMSGCGSVVE